MTSLFMESDFNGSRRKYQFYSSLKSPLLNVFMIEICPELTRIITNIGMEDNEMKVHFSLKVTMLKLNANGIETKSPAYFCIAAQVLSNFRFIDLQKTLERKINDYTNLSSGLILHSVDWLDAVFGKYQTLCRRKGRGFDEIPACIQKSKAIINVQNKDGKCFVYSVLSLTEYEKIHRNRRYNPASYSTFMKKLNLENIIFPFTSNQLTQFELDNPTYGIDLYVWNNENNSITLDRASSRRSSTLSILNVSNHFVGVRNVRMMLSQFAQYEVPEKLKNKKCCLKLDVSSMESFPYSILASLHHSSINVNQNRKTQYDEFKKELNMTGIDLPFQLKNVGKFEKQNPDIRLTIMKWKNDEVRILHSPKYDNYGRPALIILVEQSKDYFYLAVTNVSHLLNSRVYMNNFSMKREFCSRCYRPFYDEDSLAQHYERCLKGITQMERMPKVGKIQFEDYHKTISPPFVVYADLECMLEDGKRENEIQVHKPIAAAYLLVKKYPNESSVYKEFRGRQCTVEFLNSLEADARECVAWIHENSHNKIVELSLEEEESFKSTKTCHICSKSIDGNKVKDHDHYTGLYLGAAHGHCNIMRRERRSFIPIVFHNLQYDIHFLLKEAFTHKKHWDLKPIARSNEKFLSLSAYIRSNDENRIHLKFIDSYQFLPSSLSKLVSQCAKFKHSSRLDVNNSVKYGKGIFPYSYLRNQDVLKDKKLPTFDDFYDVLQKRVVITRADYSHAMLAWEEFKCSNLYDYMMAYLKLDVLLLADVFEEFRSIVMEEDGLDPVHYISIPGLSWSSAMKFSGNDITLLQDQDMYNFFEDGIRGGLTFVNKHHIVRNTPNDSSFDPNLPITDIIYIDENNLYGNSLSCKLPHSDFKWLNEEEALDIIKNIDEKCSQENSIGYVFRVDIHMPEHLMNDFNDMPLAPFKECPQEDWLTPSMMESWRSIQHKQSYVGTDKLLLTHLPKKRYVVHGEMLKFYMSCGMMVDKVHDGIQFTQDYIFKDYILYNSDKRSKADTPLKRDYYKLKNNSLYGKSQENVRKRMDVRLVNDEEKYVTYLSKPNYKADTRITEDFIQVELLKEDVVLDKPVYIGFTVLELSKLLMYKLRYKDLKTFERELNGKISIVAMDTDSFFIEIQNILKDDFWKTLNDNGLLDTSNLEENHKLYSTERRAKLGCVKDECCGKSILEAIFLRPKNYSLKLENGDEKKTAKGVQQSVVQNNMRHSNYYDTYFNQTPHHAEVRRFSSDNHNVSTIKTMKRALCAFDDKRAWIDMNESLPYGHPDIKKKK